MARGNQYIQLVKVLYCKLQTIGNQLPTFPKKVRGLSHRPQRWEAHALPLYPYDPWFNCITKNLPENHVNVMARYIIIMSNSKSAPLKSESSLQEVWVLKEFFHPRLDTDWQTCQRRCFTGSVGVRNQARVACLDVQTTLTAKWLKR